VHRDRLVDRDGTREQPEHPERFTIGRGAENQLIASVPYCSIWNTSQLQDWSRGQASNDGYCQSGSRQRPAR
jgi:hypothetical protein